MKYLILIFFICFSTNLKSQSGKVRFDSTSYSIKDCVNSFSIDNIEKTRVGYQYWFVDKNFLDGRTIKLSAVAPDSATHDPHKHLEDEFFFILEGTAEFFLNGETKKVGPMTSLYCPSQSEHGIKNIGNAELKYLVIKKYETK